MSIRDFGPGLSADRLQQVFCFFGESTKNQDNSQTGGFGIGAKSAWAYTDSFLITSFYNGNKSIYLAHIGDSEEGKLTLQSSQSTKEENGVEIKISVEINDVQKFVDSFYRCTLFWKTRPETNFKNNINTIYANIDNYLVFKDSKTLVLLKNQELDRFFQQLNFNEADDLLMIDEIIYPSIIKYDSFERNSKFKVLMIVNYDDIEITATRESIKNNKKRTPDKL